MGIWFNGNKDGKVNSFNIDDSADITLSEAVAIDGKNQITVVGLITSLPGASQSKDDLKDSGIALEFPIVASFKFNKTDYVTKWNGKEKEHKASEACKLFAQKLTELGFGKPFKGRLNFTCPSDMAILLATGQRDGVTVAPEMMAMFAPSYCEITPIEALTAFTLDDVPKAAAYGNGGSKGQTEAEKLSDRLSFLEDSLKPDSKFAAVYKAMWPSAKDDEYLTCLGSLMGDLFR